jgi:hypothetical protein
VDHDAGASANAALHAGIIQIGTGMFAIAAALQVGVVFSFVVAWPTWALFAQAAVGGVAVVLGLRLTDGQARALPGALVTTMLLLFGGVAFDLWLAANQAMAGLAVGAPVMAGVGLLSLVFSWAPISRWSALRDRALTEAFGPGAIRVGAFERPDVPVVPTIIVAIVAGMALGIHQWPAQTRRLATRVDALARGAWPSAPAQADFVYSGSPLEWYVAYEARFLPIQREGPLALADAVAREVAWEMAAAAGTGDIAAAERWFWEQGRQEEILGWAARALRERGVFYHEEALLSRSFDPALHRVPGTVHLDCDQLVWTMAHVARALDLDVRPVPAAFHAYVVYGPPDGVDADPLTVETTAFRDEAGAALGEGFYVPADHYRRGRNGTWASPELADRAGYYEPMSESWIHDAIVSEVTRGVGDADPAAPVRAEMAARIADARDPNLVTNYWLRLCDDAEAALERGDAAAAKADALEAARVRSEKGVLVSTATRREDVLLGRALWRSGDRGGALAAIGGLLEEQSGQSEAVSGAHADALLLRAELGGTLSDADVQRWLLPVFRLSLSAADGEALTAKACERLASATSAARWREALPPGTCAND